MIFDVKVRDLRFNLSLEFIRGPFKLVERLADLASYLGQLLGPEDDQGQQEDEDHFWKAQVHKSMILPQEIAINARRREIT